MPLYLGIDTSNYTTSAAIYDSDKNVIFQSKKLLSVAENEKGLRQSDAVFLHIKQISEIIANAVKSADNPISAVCVSVSPRSAEGSYMPCFLVGKAVAQSIAEVMNIPIYECSHQEGHITAALFSADRLDLLNKEFYAFHVSGGTTECLEVAPNGDLFAVKLIACTLDLNAGQLIDRIGVMLNLKFPCGKELDEMARSSKAEFKIKVPFKDLNCHFSGGENQAYALKKSGASDDDIAKFAITYVKNAVSEMTDKILTEYGEKPLVYAGGVMSNSTIREYMTEKYGGFFAEPSFSADNAAGVAIIGAIKDKNRKEL